ncbi:E3 ubiquitin-protein ligase RNF186 [Falco biarmicus]|uniref:E3 ubiquitin-protein ligase RNF186 n=1 Tax=Falco cherrug TaxID=345164 RepID=UPI001886A084|nr:E3 ubiquitin-protein ligase RNF186 [Falco cherrug]XP_037235535.1 E3 ubiquitin-protein ligase RNF186 [Falco rusticolus]XP_055562266.1 E3 ubiquitin-protein ligase RNF186 [Falco cherrug]XP_056189514.1 E3 ubiquitin-protein ligase RNF186 [Falco biarmicus]
MEKSTDKPNSGNSSTAPGVPQADKDSPVLAAEGAAEMSRAGPLTENAANVKGLGFMEEHLKKIETPSGTEQDGPDAINPAISERDCPNAKPLVMLTNINPSEACSFEMNHQCPTTTSIDTDCLVCFNKYDIYRVPKLLDCQHAFCAVCLKLILRKEESTWIITCPLCRKATFVSGGLIRTLQNKEDIMEHLENPDSNPEVHISAIGLDKNSWTLTSQDVLHGDENVPADNRLAIQRLVLLLLLVVILTILILPFIYSGLIKWVICLMLTLGLVLSMVLCCTPKFYWRCNRDSLTSCRKETHIAAIA